MISQANNQHQDWLRLDGQVCVVTGAAGGIGASIVETFVAAGARVALLDRDADGTIAIAERLRAAGGNVVAIGCDIGDAASVTQAAERVERDLGPAAVLVNNAGLLRAGGIETIDLDAWNAMLQVNLTGYMLCSQAFGRAMLARGSGVLVHVASIAARHPQTYSGAYSASKAAVAMLARQLAAEWGPRGIRSNTVCPGMIRTPLSESFYASGDIEARRSAMTANRRIGRPDDIANVVAFLASPRAAYVNGAELVVDGGLDAMLMDLVPRPGYDAGAGAR
ncbi:SDR family NAD(P)-dependent oxidoreductase [Burkholderia sp. Bp8990]|uniref:SDR family NAD(P)-dependent oxidoreductase n=1 Tax=Burkholderia sp. Bp8990 TaxID=2184552 RepID=UPI000F5911AC|nr:SDR family oxidoreductase [Burkholderia sp. Bp8990]RQS30619.1 SDR family NAD(P)-dependent oxidoreductase [Burkholderia sp. Bp8990]